MNKKKTPEREIPLQNYFAETLRDILENGTVKPAQVAAATGIPAPHLSEMKSGRRRITPENDLRLSRYFRIDSGFFLRLQMKFELEKAGRENAAAIEAIEPIPASAEN